ncbi:MAG: cytochrome C oxidase subunit IV family protein [Flavobacteriales bacterium]|nr:cytochrome C oxidase subunit IV family protein [Flavobacteriales bacterium]
MERDDIIEYSLHTHHSEEEGKKIRAKIWKVTAILTLITTVEIIVGIYAPRYLVTPTVWLLIKFGYIGLTILKAAYIVLVFMHLGDERKNLRWVILAPYGLFILYLIFIVLTEGTYVNGVWNTLM